MMESVQHPAILIAGAGPTGLMLACQLARFNIPFRIIDKTSDHTTQSRALVIQARSVEILDQMGIADEALQRGKITKAIGAFINGKKVLRVEVNNMGAGLTKFPHLLMLEQSQTERLLVDFLSRYDHHVDRQTELVHFTQDSHGVTAILKLADGREETVTTRYLVGADGAHSQVREQLHIPFGGKTYEQSLFVLDCKAKVDIANDEMYLAFAGNSFGGFFPLTNGRWRILGNLPPHLKGRTEITFDDIQAGFTARLRIQAQLFDPHWVSVYRAHHRYAAAFRKGNCFLAGDAAHIHSPVGAQGMNTGLQDACNLAWKLALVVSGLAKESLLDTYTEERIGIARNLVRSTDRVFNVVTSENAWIRTVRLYAVPLIMKAAAPLFQKIKLVQRVAFKLVSEIGISYHKHSLARNASFGKFPGHAPRPGDRWPFAHYTDEHHTEIHMQDKMRATRFCLFVFSEAIPDGLREVLAPFQHWCSIELIPRTYVTQDLYDRFGIGEQGYYLVRPDSYIACRADQLAPEFLLNYISRFLK